MLFGDTQTASPAGAPRAGPVVLVLSQEAHNGSGARRPGKETKMSNIYSLVKDLNEALEKSDYKTIDMLLGVASSHLDRHIAKDHRDLIKRIADNYDAAVMATAFTDRDKMYAHIVAGIDANADRIAEWLGSYEMGRRIELFANVGETCGEGLSPRLDLASTEHICIVLDKEKISPYGIQLCTAYPDMNNGHMIPSGKFYNPARVVSKCPEMFNDDFHRTAFSLLRTPGAKVYYGHDRSYSPYVGIRFKPDSKGNRVCAFINWNGSANIMKYGADGTRQKLSMFDFTRENPSGAAFLSNAMNRYSDIKKGIDISKNTINNSIR